MSLPSIPAIQAEMGIKPGQFLNAEQLEDILVKAMRKDLPLACNYIHSLSHQVGQSPGGVDWIENPNSPLGKQLIRMHASDAMRAVASKRIAHGQPLTFLNCCKGKVGGPPPRLTDLMLEQIQLQDGTKASADC